MTDQPPKKVLFVRSGGGFPGIDIHLGLWLALEDAGIRSTHLSGTSAGAIVSMLDSVGWKAAELQDGISMLRDHDLRRERFAWKLRIPWIKWFMIPDQIEKMLHYFNGFNLRPVPKPMSVWATDLQTGACRDVARDPFIDLETLAPVSRVAAVMASMAISGVFPSRRFSENGKTFEFVDGGVRKNLPLPADWREYDEVWLLIATPNQFDTYRKKTGVVTRLFRNIELLMHDQIADVLEETSGSPKVHVLWPPCATPRGMFRFDHSLIMNTHAWATMKIHDILNQTPKESL